MTIIEFYDKASIENVLGALMCRPERMILVGDRPKQMERSCERYGRVLSQRGITTEIACRAVATRNSLQAITDVLSQIAQEYDDCVFDLTGGEDLYLVAVGIVMERYAGRVQCQRFNIRNDTVTDCDADGIVCRVDSFDISVEENINIYGGEVVTEAERAVHTCPWTLDGDPANDVYKMWDICRKNSRLWNAHISTLGTVCRIFGFEGDDALDISYDRRTAENEIKRLGHKYVCVAWIMRELEQHGLIHGLRLDDTVSFRFDNAQIKRCLTVAGQVLELAVACRMLALKDKDGSPLYHDVRVGVVIDWDGEDDTDEYRTVNEIDVMAMKGSVPIFISCKNGDLDANELYKLNTVAERFGNKYAKRVLVCTELEKLGSKAEYLRARMDDMGIRKVENIDDMGDVEFDRVLRSLWFN